MDDTEQPHAQLQPEGSASSDATPGDITQPTTQPTAMPSSATAVPTSGWVAPALAPASPPSRTFLIFLWIAAVFIVGFLALVRSVATDGDAAYRAGYAFGGLIGPFIVAAIVRWIVVRIQRGKPGAPVGVIRSHWVPLGAMALAVLSGISGLAALTPAPPVDPATALRVGSGYTLRETDPTTAQQVADAFGGQDVLRDYVIREIVGDDGSISFVFIADGRLREADTAEMARGLGDGSGLPARVDTISGRPVAVAVGPEFALASWIEEPLLVSVLAGDEFTLRTVVVSILTTPRP